MGVNRMRTTGHWQPFKSISRHLVLNHVRNPIFILGTILACFSGICEAAINFPPETKNTSSIEDAQNCWGQGVRLILSTFEYWVPMKEPTTNYWEVIALETVQLWAAQTKIAESVHYMFLVNPSLRHNENQGKYSIWSGELALRSSFWHVELN